MMETLSQPSRPCRHFLVGKCTYGSQCSFRHDPADAAVAADSGRRMMPAKGALSVQGLVNSILKQTNMAEAAYQMATSNPVALDGDVKPSDVATRPCRHFLAGKCTYGERCNFRHAGVEMALAEPVAVVMPSNAELPADSSICRHFLLGRCTFGDQCNFKHAYVADNPAELVPGSHTQGFGVEGFEGVDPKIVQELLDGPLADGTLPGLSVAPNNGQAVEGPSRICRHFLLGKCTYGDQCNFQHQGVDIADAHPAPARSVCTHFLAGRCTFGEQCRFSHDVGAEGSSLRGVQPGPVRKPMTAPRAAPY